MKALWLGIVANLCASGTFAAQVELTFIFADKRVEKKTLAVDPDAKGTVTVLLKRNELPPHLGTLAVLPDFASARTGEEGHFVMPNGELGTFHEQNGVRTARNYMPMPVFGMKNPRATFVAIVTGMPYDFTLVTQAKDGVYTIVPRFELAGRPAYDDIAVEYQLLSMRPLRKTCSAPSSRTAPRSSPTTARMALPTKAGRSGQ